MPLSFRAMRLLTALFAANRKSRLPCLLLPSPWQDFVEKSSFCRRSPLMHEP
jgi:hypothetical protein